MHRLKFGYVLNIASQSLQLKGFNFLPIGFSKYLLLKNFFLGTMQKSLYVFVKSVSDLGKSMIYAYPDGKT